MAHGHVLYCSLWAVIGSIKEQFPFGPWPTIDDLKRIRRSEATVAVFAVDEESSRTWRNYTYDQAACLFQQWGKEQTSPIDIRLLRVLTRDPGVTDYFDGQAQASIK